MNKMIKKRLMISYTLTCTAACRHCCAEASPHRKEKLPVHQVIPQVVAFERSGGQAFIFTGGEVLIYIDELEMICEAIKEKKPGITVITNAFWANSSVKARTMADKLIDMGVDHITLSTGKFHQEFVPFEYIRHATEALKLVGIKINILLYHDRNPSIENAAMLLNISRLAVPFTVNYCNAEGRAISLEDDRNFKYHSADRILEMPCNQADLLFFDYFGNAWSCCAASYKDMPFHHFFRLGQIESNSLMSLLKRMHRYQPVLSVLYGQGPGAVFKRVRNRLERFGFKLKKQYLSQCDLCCDMLGDHKFYSQIMEHFNLN